MSEDNFAEAFHAVKGTIDPSLDLGFDKPESKTNNIEFYRALAKALQEKSKEVRWEKDDVISVEVLGETYEVGPFVNAEMEYYYSDSVGFHFKGDSFAVFAGDSFDSWGYEEGHGPEVYWQVAKVVRYVPVFEVIYN